ncbi:MAG: hemolysin III family protein [Terriglobia bacterium]
MITALKLRERLQSRGEEIANSISHGVGLLAAVVAVPILIISTVRSGNALAVVGSTVFAITLVLLYVTSTLYHALPRSKGKRVFQILDHGAIFLLIAGTYTPFTLGVLRGAWGWTLLAVIWVLATTGVVLTAVRGVRHPTLSTFIYLAMGWLFVVGVKPLWERMAPWGLFWLAAGGLAYTGGVAFFAAERVRYGHLVWHVFVIVGSACHYIAVLLYAV